MRKIYALLLFIFSISSIYSQSPLCNNATAICGNINPTPNTINTASIGSIGCLTSTPNPNWFVFKVGFAGDLNYNLYQGNNAPLYNNLDIDYICWGPFNSIPNCNTDLYDYPSGNTGMNNNVIACSFSVSGTESFTIPNANPGSYYVILTSNFSDTPGYFVLEQTNTTVPGAGSSDCDAICGSFIADTFNNQYLNDIIICNESITTYDIKCLSKKSNQDALSCQWYLNNVLQPALTTQQITVSQSGTWKVVATNPICNISSEDSINIIFSSEPAINTQSDLIGAINDCNPTFNLSQTIPNILGSLNPSENTVTFYTDEIDSIFLTNPITNLTNFATTSDTMIYVSATNQYGCSNVEQIRFLLDVNCAATDLVVNNQPQDQTINLNDTVIFSTNITNATSYEWQISTNGINWTSITNGGINPTFSGANTNTLTINNVTASYNGNMFRVKASSATDNKISTIAILSIVLSNDSFEVNQFSISPNPTKNNFALHIDKFNLTENLKYSIYDLNGRKLLESKINSLETIIPFENYQTGIYLIEIISSSGKSTKKLIKQ
jgi:hypothetical protein